ncbi:blastula protease 10-like [Diadema antillarum]|uniref:blastula protease 10-like n=1 Tax=Diadema antillarum TaxID=105358 RepID=UPI003A8BEB7D
METVYACDVSLTQQSGSFTSPEYPGEYPNNRDCKYSITVEPGFVINVTFVDFQLEFHHACEYDFVEVYDELLGPASSRRYCGPLAPFSVMSETNDVLVEFHSDTSARFRGFTAEYVAVPHKRPGSPKQVQAPLCEDQTYRDPKGSLTSPNFPYKYDNDEHCRIDIRLEDEDARVRVIFHFFDVEEHQDCTWDFVQISDNISHRMTDRLCGTLSEPLTWESDSNDVTITFRSDGLVTRTGFYATYESLAGNDDTST